MTVQPTFFVFVRAVGPRRAAMVGLPAAAQNHTRP